MKKYLLYLLIIFLALNCSNPKKGALSPGSRTVLDQLADVNGEMPSKYLDLSQKICQLLEEAAAIKGESEAMAHIREFTTENDLALSRLQYQINRWQLHLDDEERMDFLLRFHDQPYGKKLASLAPAFRKRIAATDNKAWLGEYDRLMRPLKMRK